MSLKDNVIIVTGSGSGLGRAYAEEIARQGAAVVINDVQEEIANEAVKAIESAGGRAVAVVAPVGDSSTAELLIDSALESFGRLDGIVTNAGILRDRSLLKMSDDDFDAVIKVHLRGTFNCVRAAFDYFKKNQVAGRIVTVGSPTGQRGNFGQTNYAAAKAGIVGMVRTWALEMKRAGVSVNTVIPVAATPMTETVPLFQKAVDAEKRGEPIPEFFRKDMGFGDSQDVAGIVAFLASEDAAGITGQVIGAGGDRLQVWTHPEPVVQEYKDGGWTFDDMKETGRQLILDNLQSVGEEMPELPAELQPEKQEA